VISFNKIKRFGLVKRPEGAATVKDSTDNSVALSLYGWKLSDDNVEF
jgi:hypothetical protein